MNSSLNLQTKGYTKAGAAAIASGKIPGSQLDRIKLASTPPASNARGMGGKLADAAAGAAEAGANLATKTGTYIADTASGVASAVQTFIGKSF